MSICGKSCMKEIDEVLIKEVRRHPCLYNLKSRDARNQAAIQGAWQAIAKDLGMDDNKCRRRWRLIRDTYVRYKKAQFCPSRKSFIRKDDNPFIDSLSFLDAFVKHRRMIKAECAEETNNPADYDEGFGQENPSTALTGDSDNDNDNVSSDSINTPYNALIENNFQVPCEEDYFSFSKLKREDFSPSDKSLLPDRGFYNALVTGEYNPQRIGDELECFVKSVSGTLHRLTPKQQAIAKVKIQQLLLDIEFGDESSASFQELQTSVCS